MPKTTGDIAKAIKGRLVGSPDVEIKQAAEIDQAGPDNIVFGFEKEFLEKVKTSKAGAVLLEAELKGLKIPQIIVKNGRLGLAQAMALLNPIKSSEKDEIHATAVIDKSVKKGSKVTVGPYAVIEKGASIGNNVLIGAHAHIGENVKIDDDTVIFPNVVVYADTVIGKRVRLNSGSIIGVDGFGFVQEKGQNIKIPQVGKVVLEDDVELCGANTIARATISETRIGAGTKIDSMIHIGHNVKIGKNCIVVASAAIAGNAVLGNNVIVAGKAGIIDHAHIGDNSVIMANSVVLKDLPANSVVYGFPARDVKTEKKNQVIYGKLSEWANRIKDLEKKVFPK